MEQKGDYISKKTQSTANEYKKLSAGLKYQMNDIIDIAYKDMPEKLSKMKRFSIYCTDKLLKTKLGDCRHNTDGSCRIRIFGIKDESFRAILITTLHEVAHHIDYILRGRSGHDSEFYEVLKKLLFTALNMGIISRNDVINSETRSRSKDKLVTMLKSYVPKPVSYKEENVIISIYNAYSEKEKLKEKGYSWNPIDESWVKETKIPLLEEEKEFLKSIKIEEKNIKTVKSSAVITRLRKTAFVYGIPFEEKEKVKVLGFRWEKEKKCWIKKIERDILPEEEYSIIKNIKGSRIEIR